MNKPLHIVVVSADSCLSSQAEDPGNGEIVHVKEIQALVDAAATRPIDVLVLGDGVKSEELALLGPTVDLSKTVVLAGPVPAGHAIATIKSLLENGKGGKPSPALPNATLDNYIESKFSEFVRAMKASSARSLYSTLIHAVERPLIELALRETHGNQIQAAQLLGMNRNTLRKKISERKIAVKVKRRSWSHPEEAAH